MFINLHHCALATLELSTLFNSAYNQTFFSTLQGEDLPDWDKGLPVDILGQVAGGKDELKAMRGVSKTWQQGFEISVKGIVGTGSCRLPSAADVKRRFPRLTTLDVALCTVEESSLECLAGIRNLTNLRLGNLRRVFWEPLESREGVPMLLIGFTGLGLIHLHAVHGLPPLSLSLEICPAFRPEMLQHLPFRVCP